MAQHVEKGGQKGFTTKMTGERTHEGCGGMVRRRQLAISRRGKV